MKKGFLFRTLPATLLLSVILALSALAESVSTELDPFSGLPTGENTAESEPRRGDGLIPVSEGVYYDPERGLFAHELGGALPSMLFCSVPDGTVTCDPVKIAVPGGYSAQLYRNGTAAEDTDLSAVSEPGSYVLQLGGAAGSVRPLQFTVVSPVTGALDMYRVPAGFYVSAVTLNGTPVPYAASAADLSGEGAYSVLYRCQAADLNLRLDVTVDHTPPTLRLEAVTDGVAKGPVDISDAEEDASVLVELDGKRIAPGKTLTRSGQYRVVLTDEAGNQTEYRFRILLYFNVGSYVFLTVVAILAVVLIVHLLLSNRRLRVR